MKAKRSEFLREALAMLVLGGFLLSVPMPARSEDLSSPPIPATTQVPARVIILPMMRVGGIPQGQIMQITEHGSELVAATRIMLAAATQVAATAHAAPAPKSAQTLFCAGSM